MARKAAVVNPHPAQSPIPDLPPAPTYAYTTPVRRASTTRARRAWQAEQDRQYRHRVTTVVVVRGR